LVKLLIVIVNYRTPELVVACLTSISTERSDAHPIRVVVVDNPSGDDSVAVLNQSIASAGWNAWVDVRPMPKNGGFSYGVNAGVMPALSQSEPPDAFLLLNPDTIIHPGAITTLVRFLESRPEVGIAGSRLEDPDGTVQHSRFRFPSVASELDNGLALGFVTRLLRHRVSSPPLVGTAHRTDWLSGACQIIRRDVFEAVGGFDERFFLYFEELDFARRANSLGIQSWYVPESRVVHLAGQSTGIGVRNRRPGRMPAYWFESRARYLDKHHGRFYRLAADLSFAQGRACCHALRVLRLRPNTDPPWLLLDFIHHSCRLWRNTST
jgi:N-acetylglucosaminyl-diphospho-decaprenol L-rhamnosyltransferase